MRDGERNPSNEWYTTYIKSVFYMPTWVSESESDLSSYGCRIRRSLWSSRSTCLSSFHRVLVSCMNSWYYNSKYSEPHAITTWTVFLFFLSDVILSQRDIWELSEQYTLSLCLCYFIHTPDEVWRDEVSWNRQTDRRTDGRTDRITITKTAQRIASRGKNQLN